jgi:hypothetical protein
METPMSTNREHEPNTPTPATDVEGEGSYSAAREYNRATRAFVESGRVGQAAEDAAPRDEQQARELEQAETAGKDRGQEEDAGEVGGHRGEQGRQDA